MDTIRLVEPAAAYFDDLRQFRQEIFAANDEDCFAGCAGLRKFDDPADWIAYCKTFEDPKTCPADKVPASVYMAVRESDNKIVGMIDLRHHLNNPVLSLWGGHIGYSVRPSERRKGYAKEMLGLVLEKARERGIEKVLITCHPRNDGSRKTILANGGVLEKNIEVEGEGTVSRYWITL